MGRGRSARRGRESRVGRALSSRSSRRRNAGLAELDRQMERAIRSTRRQRARSRSARRGR